MIRVNVVIDHPRWKKKIKNPEKYLKKKIKKLSKIFAFKKKIKNFLFY